MAMPYSDTLIGPVKWYAALIVSGIAMAILIAEHEQKRLGLPKETAIDLVLFVIPFGIIGARLYYVLMKWDLYRDNLLSILNIREGGLAIYGGVLTGILVCFLFARKRKLSFGALLDILAPGVILAQVIGRWGNYFNMEAYGPRVLDPRFCFFPFAVLIPESGGTVWHMATFFYESLWNTIGFILIMLFRKQKKKNGDVMALYLFFYGAGRYMIEQLRMDSLYIGSYRVSVLVSVLTCAAGIIWLLKDSVVSWPALMFIPLFARWFIQNSCICVLLTVFPVLIMGSYMFNMHKPKHAALVILLMILDCLLRGTQFSFPPEIKAMWQGIITSISMPCYLLCCYSFYKRNEVTTICHPES